MSSKKLICTGIYQFLVRYLSANGTKKYNKLRKTVCRTSAKFGLPMRFCRGYEKLQKPLWDFQILSLRPISLPVNGFVEPFAGFLFFGKNPFVHCLYIVLKNYAVCLFSRSFSAMPLPEMSAFTFLSFVTFLLRFSASEIVSDTLALAFSNIWQ